MFGWKTTTLFYDHVAKKVGVNAAILLSYIGRYWWTVSISGIGKCLPYLSEKQIRNALNKLINRGYIMARCLNNSAYDRTLSYALTYKGAALLNGEEV